MYAQPVSNPYTQATDQYGRPIQQQPIVIHQPGAQPIPVQQVQAQQPQPIMVIQSSPQMPAQQPVQSNPADQFSYKIDKFDAEAEQQRKKKWYQKDECCPCCSGGLECVIL